MPSRGVAYRSTCPASAGSATAWRGARVRRLEWAGDEAGRVSPATSKMEVSASGVLGADQVLAVAEADVGKLRERGRRRRLARLGVLVGMLAMWALYRV